MAVLMRHHLCGLVFLLIMGTEMSLPARAEDGLQLHEEEIEAGLIYNFLKYIQWPETATGPTAPITVCIFGDDPFKGYLRPMANRTVNRRPITLRTIHDLPSTANCDLLFFNAAEKDQWPRLEKYLSGKNILTVSNLDDFSSSGGMVEFGRKNDHVHVSLNIDTVMAASLRVEDRLLKLVTVTHSASDARH